MVEQSCRSVGRRTMPVYEGILIIFYTLSKSVAAPEVAGDQVFLKSSFYMRCTIAITAVHAVWAYKKRHYKKRAVGQAIFNRFLFLG